MQTKYDNSQIYFTRMGDHWICFHSLTREMVGMVTRSSPLRSWSFRACIDVEMYSYVLRDIADFMEQLEKP